MQLRYPHAVLATLVFMSLWGTIANALDDKKKTLPGADFHHPIYLPVADQSFTARGIGDASLRRDIVYILRLEEGKQLTATLSSSGDAAREPNVIALSLVDGKATSFEDAIVIVRKTAKPTGEREPGRVGASINYVAPTTGDYYLVAEFNGPGIVFELTTTAKRVLDVKSDLLCVEGRVTNPVYVSPGLQDSLISDFVIGDSKVDPPNEHNRHFCLTVCTVRPPTSHVLSTILQTAFNVGKNVKACWDSSNTVTAVTLSE